jgi:hypothetical protein
LYEGVVMTPRNLDQAGRSATGSVPSELPIACCQASPHVRMRSSPMMGFEKRLWRQPIIQLLDVSSFERLVQIYTK